MPVSRLFFWHTGSRRERPVIQAHPSAKILIVGQAPGTAVHRTGIPFNDPSGDRLRAWLGVDKDVFYDAEKIALVPMGFCYPGPYLDDRLFCIAFLSNGCNEFCEFGGP